ncbi:hypothetical protein GcM3_190021 [Golovinomyces cichoracearum]|uniref:Uncharacterized protein n=1 Tax=Golovinomyces cichoracearum TaxID=62708 RepID=A0A420HHZ6_9PEZI|nr:hypothetical protein GcM3_190021 [Golovinomyces cichoracearum]
MLTSLRGTNQTQQGDGKHLSRDPEFSTNEIWISMEHVKLMERIIAIGMAPRKTSTEDPVRMKEERKKERSHSKVKTLASRRRGRYSRYYWFKRLE